MAEAFVGTWNFQSSDNFDKYLEELKVNVATRAMAATSKPTLIISLDGATWTLKSETLFKNTKLQFQLGVEFDETTADDRKMKTTFTLEGNKLIQDQKGDQPSVITREVEGDKMTVLCKANNVVATRIYAKKL